MRRGAGQRPQKSTLHRGSASCFTSSECLLQHVRHCEGMQPGRPRDGVLLSVHRLTSILAWAVGVCTHGTAMGLWLSSFFLLLARLLALMSQLGKCWNQRRVCLIPCPVVEAFLSVVWRRIEEGNRGPEMKQTYRAYDNQCAHRDLADTFHAKTFEKNSLPRRQDSTTRKQSLIRPRETSGVGLAWQSLGGDVTYHPPRRSGGSYRA